MLRGPKRPPFLREQLSPEMSEFRAQVLVDLDEHRFGGATAGPSGMTSEHLRLLLDRPADLQILFQVSEILARGEVSGFVASSGWVGYPLSRNQAVENFSLATRKSGRRQLHPSSTLSQREQAASMWRTSSKL